MSVHLPSFLLGLATVPLVALVVLAGYRLAASMSGSRGILAAKRSSRSPDGFEPLRFTPRLMGRLSKPLDPDHDHAQAS